MMSSKLCNDPRCTPERHECASMWHLSDAQVIEERNAGRISEDKEFILKEDWPVWPVLPMKNNGRTGILFKNHLRDRFDFIVDVNLFDVSAWKAENITRNINIDELLAEGWMVD